MNQEIKKYIAVTCRVMAQMRPIVSSDAEADREPKTMEELRNLLEQISLEVCQETFAKDAPKEAGEEFNRIVDLTSDYIQDCLNQTPVRSI